MAPRPPIGLPQDGCTNHHLKVDCTFPTSVHVLYKWTYILAKAIESANNGVDQALFADDAYIWASGLQTGTSMN